VFNFQSFSIHGGPGIRTTMFLKGCPLHCPWCSNPESINPAIQIKSLPEKYRGCKKCSDACESGALSRDNGKVHEVGAQRCCFLPVHRWGEHKYSRLGLANPYEHIREFSAGGLQIGKERYKGQEGFVFFEAV